MNRLIIALGILTVWINLAQAQPRGLAVYYGSDGGVCSAVVSHCDEGYSCELIVEAACPMTLEECLYTATVGAADSEETADVLGCSPDARRVDVDAHEVGL